MAKVLIVDSDQRSRSELATEVRCLGHDVRVASSYVAALEILGGEAVDVMLAHCEVRQRGSDLLESARDVSPATRCVLMGEDATANDYKVGLERGAVDVLNIPCNPGDLERTLGKALDCHSGYHGTLHGLELLDILQMLHLARRSVVLRIGSDRAQIHLQDGEIVHATSGGQVGKDALLTLLASRSGSVETRAAESCPQTIDQPFEGLVLDTLRQIDEGAAGIGNDPVALSDSSIPLLSDPNVRVLSEERSAAAGIGAVDSSRSTPSERARKPQTGPEAPLTLEPAEFGDLPITASGRKSLPFAPGNDEHARGNSIALRPASSSASASSAVRAQKPDLEARPGRVPANMPPLPGRDYSSGSLALQDPNGEPNALAVRGEMRVSSDVTAGRGGGHWLGPLLWGLGVGALVMTTGIVIWSMQDGTGDRPIHRVPAVSLPSEPAPAVVPLGSGPGSRRPPRSAGPLVLNKMRPKKVAATVAVPKPEAKAGPRSGELPKPTAVGKRRESAKAAPRRRPRHGRRLAATTAVGEVVNKEQSKAHNGKRGLGKKAKARKDRTKKAKARKDGAKKDGEAQVGPGAHVGSPVAAQVDKTVQVRAHRSEAAPAAKSVARRQPAPKKPATPAASPKSPRPAIGILD